jgi:dipeptidyl aminopeptidase/acylaminoacyl peptidase
MIFEINEIRLPKKQLVLLHKGWGKDISENTITSRIKYLSDGIEVEGYISKPLEFKSRLPVIIWNRGGNRSSGKIDDFLASGILGEIASWGYLVIASNYRENDQFGGEDVNDILNLIDIIDDFTEAESNLIGMEGWSRGGMMMYLCLSKTNRIKCAIAVSAVANLERTLSINPVLNKFVIELTQGYSKEVKDEFIKKRSAVDFYEEINPNTPTLFIHGNSDDKVSYFDSVDLYEKLKSKNTDTEYKLELIEKGDHYLSRNKELVRAYRKDWFDMYLKRY